MAEKVFSCSFTGLKCSIIEVQADISNGMPQFSIVGMGDTSVQESKERIRSSIKNSGAVFPQTRKVINLAPAQLKKQGVLFDLPIAAGILLASGQASPAPFKETVIVGELSLDGAIRPVNGVLPLTQHAKERGFKKIILPYENAAEAGFINGIEIYPVKNLREFIAFFRDGTKIEKIKPTNREIFKKESKQDFSFVKLSGLLKAKRALTIAAAGHHNILLYGSPGCGKTVLARCLKSLGPKMSEEEMMECTKIFSVAGLLDKNFPIVSARPFREVHHTASAVALVGGGGHSPNPGEITLAHNGVLFLDEIAEFNKDSLEALRQPLEDKKIHINRSNFSATFPCDFMLAATMNPCPCGYKGDKKVQCKCTDTQIKNYHKKISGPLLDRFDIFLEVERSDLKKIFEESPDEKEFEEFEKLKQSIERASRIQKERFLENPNVRKNSDMEIQEIRNYCRLEKESQNLLNKAAENFNLSNRGYLRTLKIARTIADFDGSEKIEVKHITEALQYRNGFQSYL